MKGILRNSNTRSAGSPPLRQSQDVPKQPQETATIDGFDDGSLAALPRHLAEPQTPTFMKNMIEYCVSEIREGALSSVEDYDDAVDQMTSQLDTPSFPLSSVATIDKTRLSKTLQVIHSDVVRVNADSDEVTKAQVARISAAIAKLLVKLEDHEKFEPPLLEDWTALWDSKARWGVDISQRSPVIGLSAGTLPTELVSEMPSLAAYEHVSIRGDGACWVRAVWQVVFGHTLDDPMLYQALVSRIRAACEKFKEEPRFFRHNDPNDVLAILEQLRRKDPSERVQMLNFDGVDQKLNMFMRKLIAAELRSCVDVLAPEDAEYLDAIELPHTPGGAHEIKCFAEWIGLDIHEVARVFRDDGTTLQLHVYPKNDPVKLDSFPPVMIYGVSSAHYEILRRV